MEALSMAKGSLTLSERKEIESHVVHTHNFLQMIPWTDELAGIPEIAGRHHEKLDGTGYPDGLVASEIPLQSRIMTICDIYDALTATDRPYKKAAPDELPSEFLERKPIRACSIAISSNCLLAPIHPLLHGASNTLVSIRAAIQAIAIRCVTRIPIRTDHHGCPAYQR